MRDITTGGAGLQLHYLSIRNEFHIGIFQCGIDTDHLSVRLGIDQAWVSIARRAANAWALAPVLLVEHDAERNVERLVSKLLQLIVQFLNARLVADRWIGITSTCPRIRRIYTAFTMHLVETLCFGVIRL